VLATNWQAASREEKRRFAEFFSQYLEDTYRSEIDSHTNQRAEYAAESITGKRAVVETLIVTDRSRISVNYKLKDNDGEWFAHDVVIEGMSLVSDYRNTFDAIVRAQGMEGLLKDPEGRIANYRATRRESPGSSTPSVAPSP
jgi:phospholipid transport system substrate-binding protein